MLIASSAMVVSMDPIPVDVSVYWQLKSLRSLHTSDRELGPVYDSGGASTWSRVVVSSVPSTIRRPEESHWAHGASLSSSAMDLS